MHPSTLWRLIFERVMLRTKILSSFLAFRAIPAPSLLTSFFPDPSCSFHPFSPAETDTCLGGSLVSVISVFLRKSLSARPSPPFGVISHRLNSRSFTKEKRCYSLESGARMHQFLLASSLALRPPILFLFSSFQVPRRNHRSFGLPLQVSCLFSLLAGWPFLPLCPVFFGNPPNFCFY